MLLRRCMSGLTLSRYVTCLVCVADLRCVFDVRDIYNNMCYTKLFDYKEHGVVDAIVPTKIQRGLPVRPITAVRQPPAGLGSPDLHSSGAPSPPQFKFRLESSATLTL